MTMKTEPKIILETSPEAAVHETRQVTAWWSRHGVAFDDERTARYHGCTHRTCEVCGTIYLREGWCRPCHEKQDIERWNKMPLGEWTDENIYDDATQRWFESPDDVSDYYFDEGIDPVTARCIIGVRWTPHEFEEDDVLGDLHDTDDVEHLRDALDEALANANQLIRDALAGFKTYEVGTKRLVIASREDCDGDT